MNQAESLFAQSRYEEAVKLFQKVLTLDPKVYQAAFSVAIALSRKAIGTAPKNGISGPSRSIRIAKLLTTILQRL